MRLFIVSIVCLSLFASRGSTFVRPDVACEKSLHIENDPSVVKLSEYAGCTVHVTTSEDRVLAFQHVEGAIADLTGLIKIRDDRDMSYVSLEKEENEELRKLNVNYNKTAYSVGTGALLEVDIALASSESHLRISRAVSCPFNLGAESQCGRVVDEESCYCATFTKRTWTDQNIYCIDKGFKFLAVESSTEELAINTAWGTTSEIWMSLNDIDTEGLWRWYSTATNLYPGYANWGVGEPTNAANEDCVTLTELGNVGWSDYVCTKLADGVCELHP